MNSKPDPDKIRFLVYTTIFGTLWGIAEAVAGTWLHMMQFPFRGALMAAIGCVALSIERSYTPHPWASLTTGLVAICFKMISIGALRIFAAAGIAIEALIAEIIFLVFGLNRFSIALAAIFCCLESIPHFFFTNWLLYGNNVFNTYLKAAHIISKTLPFSTQTAWLLFAFWIAGHLAIGAAAAYISIYSLRYLRRLK